MKWQPISRLGRRWWVILLVTLGIISGGASVVLVANLVRNTVTRDQLCASIDSFKQDLLAPQVAKSIPQTKALHVPGYGPHKKHRAIAETRAFLRELYQPTCS